jgi:hypothetical protein
MSAKTERNSEITFNRLCSKLDLTKENGNECENRKK